MEKKILASLKSKNNDASSGLAEWKKTKTIGIHLVAELVGCDFETLNDEKKIKEAMLNASAAAKFTVLDVLIKKFNPQGVTALLLLSESHFSLHSWPEMGYAAVDMFTCSKTSDPQEAFKVLLNYFKPKRYTSREMARGPNAV
ncbi:MAG: adenosylmethionine decarboxylase [Candidatus Aenigmarchaeota archaeon]|nr:adenosylmethionine decarboxylase [Candidatus Aenigmarchaeota archaeon]